MENDSLGNALPRILFTYAQQWANRSGYTLLSQLLIDEQFQGLIEKYGGEIVTLMASGTSKKGNGRGNGNGNGNGNKSKPLPDPRVSETDASDDDLTSLHDRVLALEEQQEAQQALFEALLIKIRPLALALGCCPACLAGIEGCPKCGGQSKVGLFPPDFTLLEAQVVTPLAARGVPLSLNQKERPRTSRQSKIPTTTRKESEA
jgi:hypothetical protein